MDDDRDIKFDIVIGHQKKHISITPPSFMKFCPVVPEICRGQVHVPKKERRKRIIIIIYKYSLLLRSIRVSMDLKNNIHQSF
jgi:hypothetical protein